MHQEEPIFFGTRIPVFLKAKLSKFCLNHGIKMNYFVSQAIKEKLEESLEEEKDVLMAKERLQDAQFTTQEDMHRYLAKRNLKR